MNIKQAASIMSARGASKGGIARAKSLSARARRAIAKKAANIRWNKAQPPEYHVWVSMKNRCYNSHNKRHAIYGARGITVCARWRASFAAFLEDVGPRPSTLYSIERINNDGNYEPGNVKWATSTEQARNRRSNVILEFNGKRQHLSDWSKELGIKRTTLVMRLKCYGWSVDRALSTTVGKR